MPSEAPTASTTTNPTAVPTASPTTTSAKPTTIPTAIPTTSPTASPTATPATVPTTSPTTSQTTSPTSKPTKTASPTAKPTANPTASPTASPIAIPTAIPTSTPSATSTSNPSFTPSSNPDAQPTADPSIRATSSTSTFSSIFVSFDVKQNLKGISICDWNKDVNDAFINTIRSTLPLLEGTTIPEIIVNYPSIIVSNSIQRFRQNIETVVTNITIDYSITYINNNGQSEVIYDLILSNLVTSIEEGNFTENLQIYANLLNITSLEEVTSNEPPIVSGATYSTLITPSPTSAPTTEPLDILLISSISSIVFIFISSCLYYSFYIFKNKYNRETKIYEDQNDDNADDIDNNFTTNNKIYELEDDDDDDDDYNFSKELKSIGLRIYNN
jgi:hypothetical protein